MSARVLAAVIVVCFLCAGCGASRALTTRAPEYQAYRPTRVSPTLEGRLIAAERYLAKYPSGSYAVEVRAFFETAEPLYFETNRSTGAGLHRYLIALPSGPHADEAKQRLHTIRSRKAGSIGFEASAAEVDARIGKMAAQRAAARNEILDTLRRFLDPNLWKRPLSEARADVLVPWSLSLPRPRCTFDDGAKGGPTFLCAKLIELPYELAMGEGRSEERQATMEIVLLEDAWGRPKSVTIGGSDLFLRLDETFTGRANDRSDSRDQSRALTRAVELVRQVFSSKISDEPSCHKTAAGDEISVYACKGVRISVLPGLSAAEDDRIRIVPAGAP